MSFAFFIQKKIAMICQISLQIRMYHSLIRMSHFSVFAEIYLVPHLPRQPDNRAVLSFCLFQAAVRFKCPYERML